MSSVTLNVRVEQEIKEQLAARADSLGLTLTAFVNLALTQVLKAKELVLTPAQDHELDDEPSPKLARILRQAKRDYERGEVYGPFTAAESSAFLESLMN
jgi:antitoxin component of RelBE/YafQ-DinJ toxin-antitoxin module